MKEFKKDKIFLNKRKEIWLPFDLYVTERYYISNLGRVMRAKTKKILKPCKRPNGYYVCGLMTVVGLRSFYIHRLVAMTFILIDKDFTKLQVNHINGKKKDNRVTNLEWVTGSENIKHAYREKLIQPLKGINKPTNKYSEELIRDICYMLQERKRNIDIHRELGLYTGNRKLDEKYRVLIKKIKYKVQWTHISREYHF